ncbi:MAG: PorT family protein [Muribaculaceae bacterium]|nr:PorT family protein [Muribaculaceae bacterium]
MKRLSILLLLTLTLTSLSRASDFFSTERSENLFTFGARIGVNTSNRTVSSQSDYGYNVQGWGTGFDLGVVADLNIRDFISLQPGFFFESRSNTYTFIQAIPISGNEEYHSAQAGTFNSYSLVIPILANIHFNLTDDVRWNVEVGPYFAINLGSKLNNKVNLNTNYLEGRPLAGNEFRARPAGGDFGLKFGTGIELFSRYTVNIDYMAGMRHAWKNDLTNYGGRTKAWTFTIGYNF